MWGTAAAVAVAQITWMVSRRLVMSRVRGRERAVSTTYSLGTTRPIAVPVAIVRRSNEDMRRYSRSFSESLLPTSRAKAVVAVRPRAVPTVGRTGGTSFTNIKKWPESEMIMVT